MEAIGRLAGGVAYDFNNLLGVILGSAELLRKAALPGAPYIERVEQIKWLVKKPLP
jgi:two-component system cell cycle sensor histidine kinase/response regulator CckA